MGVLFFFAVLGYAMLLMLALPRIKAGHALLSSVCGMLFAAYYGVIIAEWMIPVAFVLMYGGLAGLAAGCICAALNVRCLRSRLFSPGMVAFVLLCAYAVWDAHTFLIKDHDDLSFWARVIRELYTFDRFHIHSGSTMFHMDYIPLHAALQYSVVRVFGWQDAYCTYVTAACIASSAAAMAESFRKRWVAAVMSVLFLFALKLYGFGIGALRADGSMLTVFTAGVLCLISREDDSWASVLPSLMCCAVLTGFKIYSGLMYAAVIVIGMAAEWISAARHKRPCRIWAAAAVLSVVLIIAMQVSWSIKYNYASALAEMERTGAETAVPVGELLSGNPRTAALMRSFTPEKIEKFLQLAGQTMQLYVFSKLIWTWLFLIPVIVLGVISSREKRAAAVKAFLLVLLAAVIYLMGLFASYFVQSETSGAAMHYLSTASAPLLISALFLTVWLGQENARAAAAVLTALMAGGMSLLCPPAELIPDMEMDEYQIESALAVDFYEYEIDGLLTEEDYGKRALLIENSYQATEVSSRSGKTHAYAYFGLPVRVLEPIYYVYGDYTQLDETFDAEKLRQQIIDSRCELLMLRVEDFLYWEAICDALELYGDYDDCIGVYDVIYEDGELSFAFRLPPDEEWEE